MWWSLGGTPVLCCAPLHAHERGHVTTSVWQFEVNAYRHARPLWRDSGADHVGALWGRFFQGICVPGALQPPRGHRVRASDDLV